MTDAERLKDAIETMEQAKATHVRSNRVLELLGQQVAWQGQVETFDLEGHHEASRCYAWTWEDESGQSQYAVILHRPPVDSPDRAVKAFIASQT